MFLVSALEGRVTEQLSEQRLHLPSTQLAKKSSIFQHLLAAHEQRLTLHPQLNDVLEQLLEGTLHIEDALSQLNVRN